MLTGGTERTNAHASIPWPTTGMAQRAWQDLANLTFKAIYSSGLALGSGFLLHG